jgi:ferredoxin-NADP reductase
MSLFTDRIELMSTASQPSANGREKLRVRLQSITYAAHETLLYEFVSPTGEALPPVTAGAHVDVHLPNGMVRSYSLVHAGDALDRFVIGVKLDPKSRGGSRYMHEQTRVGMSMDLSMPRNHFPLKEDAPHTVLIAGGIGITPIWCMAQRLQEIGASWELWYACRSRKDMAFLPELAKYSDRVHLHADEDSKGVLDIAGLIAAAPAATHFYCCGPAPMLRAYESAASTRPPETVHLERFAASEPVTLKGNGYVVQLARSGRELFVPAESTLLDVLTSNGVSIDSSCQAGICGCCEVRVLEGEIDHRDEVLTEAERAGHKSMMACCSRAKGERLVLDL